MKYQVGDIFLNKITKTTVLIIEITNSGLFRGIYSDNEKIYNVGYDQYIQQRVHEGMWQHYPVKT